MNDDRNPFDDATAVADQAELLELQKPKRNFANVVKRGQPSQSIPVRTPQPVSPQPVSQPHLIRRDAAGLPEDSSEVLLTPANITVPLGKAGGANAYQEHNGNEEFTVEEGRPQPPAALVDIAEQANLAVAPADDPDRGFLVITGGNDKGRKVGLPEGRTTIGRGIDCDIVLTDIAVSRRHMYVERRDNVYFLCDLSSGNGTFVNNKDRRGEVVVVNGDTFKIGSTQFSFEGPEAQDSAAATTNWQPEAVASGKAVGRYDAQASEEEESTVAGKGLANVRGEQDPPSELPTNIVASVEVAPQLQAQARPPRPATKPPPLPQDLHDAEQAALAAVSSIIQTPPPEENSVIALQTGDLPDLSIPPTPSPAIPYPIPGQHSAPAPAPPHSSLPQPRGPAPSAAVPAMQGHMGMTPPIQQGPSSMHMQPSYPVPGNMPQGSNPMMGRPMMAGARPDFHNPYQPANRAAPPARGRLLIGIISVALVLVVVGIVAAVVGQGEDKVATTPAVIEADGGAGEAAGPMAEGSDAAAGETAPEAVATADPETADPENTDPETADPEGADPENTEPTAEGTASESEPILVASLIAGTTQLPASTWGTSELFTKEAAPVPEPIVEPVPEPIAEPVVEPKPEPKPQVETPKPLVRKPKPAVVRKPRVEPKPRQDPDESSGNEVNTSAAKSSARSLYKRREYADAASTLEKAASRIEDDNDAMKLNDIADAYKKVGSSMEKAERIQNSSPIEALELYKKSLSRDKKYAGGALAKLIRLRIGQVAPKAAKTLMAQGKLSQAKKAADTAKRYDEGQAVESVYKSLERKANSLIKKALKAKKNGDDGEAKDLLREATSIAPKGTPAYDKCRDELRKL
jgi:pSer/pThr/pTyr-binding forkhead associated (FHA) protein